MRIDPRVTRRKFQKQLALLPERLDYLRGRRCVVTGTSFPYVEAVVYPTLPMEVGAVIIPEGTTKKIQTATPFKYLVSRPVGARLDFTDFDQRAPSVTFHDPLTWDLLPYEQIPPGAINGKEGKRPVILDKHPETARPFICMGYIREYHEHPQHNDNPWVWYRPHFSLPNVLGKIADCLVKPTPCVLAQQLHEMKRFRFQ